ncbi:ninja-family protein [Musa troglodytarum]|uniref:Ninja-family protein n=2 Tax=Musa troglodytarum TaxID=320322 RepID=A0A9E7I038_9LILI|nr:ninja-family protein [Musa troglodytarum]
MLSHGGGTAGGPAKIFQLVRPIWLSEVEKTGKDHASIAVLDACTDIASHPRRPRQHPLGTDKHRRGYFILFLSSEIEKMEDDNELELKLGLSFGGSLGKSKSKNIPSDSKVEEASISQLIGIGVPVSDVPFNNFFWNNVGNQNQSGKQAVFPSRENFRTDNDKCSGPTTDGYDIAQSSQSQFTRQKELHIASNRPNEFEEEKLGLKKPRLQSEKINFQKKHEKVVDHTEVLGKGPDEATSVKRSHLLVAAYDGSTGENEDVAESEAEVSSSWDLCPRTDTANIFWNTSNVELPKVTYGTPLSLQPLTVSMVPYPIPAKPTVVGAPITTSSPSPYVAQPTIPTKDEHPVVQGTNTDDQQIVFGYSSVHLPSLETNSSWAFGSQPQIVSSLAVGTSNSLLHEDETKRSNGQSLVSDTYILLMIIHMPELLCYVRAVSTQMHPSTNLGYENKLAGLAKGNDKHVVETGASSSSKAEEGKGISYILRQKQTTNPLVVEGFRHDGSAIKPGVSSNLQFGGCGSFPDLPCLGNWARPQSGLSQFFSEHCSFPEQCRTTCQERLQVIVTEAVAHPLEQILPRPAQLKFISNGLQMEKKLKTKSTNKARLDCGTVPSAMTAAYLLNQFIIIVYCSVGMDSRQLFTPSLSKEGIGAKLSLPTSAKQGIML